MFESTVLDRIRRFRKPRRTNPRHIAMTVEDNYLWQKKNKKSAEDTFAKRDSLLHELIREQVQRLVPILTVLLLPLGRRDELELESLERFFSELKHNPAIHRNQMRVSIMGKWYDLPGILVEEIKDVIGETKHYDRYFLNFCVNYDGQEEIVDSCKLIVRSVVARKLSISEVTKQTIKDNLYSSYFLPPDLIIKTGLKRTWSTLLLWDCPNAHVFFAGKVFNDFTISDLTRAIEEFTA